MSFQNPWGLLALLAVPALIALYILKQKHKEIPVPGLLLWKRTQSMMEASTPWQKLRRNLLFFLQLLAVIILALAIAGPTINRAGVYDDICVIIDTSASMQAENEDGKTRYERALDECRGLADSLSDGQTMSVIFAGSTVYPAVSHSDSRYEIRDAIEAFNGCLYSEADMETAVLLADSMKTDSANSEILVLTDYSATSDKSYIKYVNLADTGNNTAILRFTSGKSGDSLMAMSVVGSFGESKTVTLELYADGVLCDAKNAELEDGKTETVYWYSVPDTATLLTLKIKEDDILAADNTLHTPVGTGETSKIMIVSDSGYFWEKVISAVSSCELYKVTPANYAGNDNDYNLIIFDGFVPAELPEGCSLWLVNPGESFDGITVGSQIKGTYLTKGSGTLCDELCEYVNPASVILSAFYELTPDSSYTPVLLCGEYPALCAKTGADGSKTAVFAFDIHNSNLALLKDFPVLVNNLVSWSIPTMLEGDGTVDTGNTVEVRALTYSTEITVTDPDGKTSDVKNGYFTADIPGLYKVTQKLVRTGSEGTSESYVTGYVVSVIPSSESAMTAEAAENGADDGQTTLLDGQQRLRPYLLVALMLLMLAEWWVYNREY